MKRQPGHRTQGLGFRRTSTSALLGMCLSAALVAAGCTSGSGGGAGGTASRDGTVGQIPQPAISDLQVAPESERVDIAMPIFSDPTNVTNPLFPVSKQESVLMLGHVDDQPFR